jgi:predicted transcriptional regulator
MFPELTSISRRRKALGIAQRRLAGDAGCSQSYLAKIEHGKVVPNYLLAGRLFHVLDAAEHQGEKAVGDIMHTPVISFDTSDSVAHASRAAKLHRVSQFPILRRGHPVGCVTTKQMLGNAANVQLGRIMGPALPSVDLTTSINAVRPLLREEQPAVLVLDRGEIVGIVTAEDLL